MGEEIIEKGALSSKPISREEQKERESWLKYILETSQETPKRLEDAAKFLATMISVLFVFFLSNKNIEGFIPAENVEIIIKTVMFCWCISLLCMLFIIVPWAYKIITISVKDIKEKHKKIVLFKFLLFICGSTLFWVPFLIVTLYSVFFN